MEIHLKLWKQMEIQEIHGNQLKIQRYLWQYARLSEMLNCQSINQSIGGRPAAGSEALRINLLHDLKMWPMDKWRRGTSARGSSFRSNVPDNLRLNDCIEWIAPNTVRTHRTCMWGKLTQLPSYSSWSTKAWKCRHVRSYAEICCVATREISCVAT